MYVPEKSLYQYDAENILDRVIIVFLEYFRDSNSGVCIPEKSPSQSAILKKFFISSQLYFLNILRILILV
jgi:hypothetical protein